MKLGFWQRLRWLISARYRRRLELETLFRSFGPVGSLIWDRRIYPNLFQDKGSRVASCNCKYEGSFCLFHAIISMCQEVTGADR